MLWLISHNPTFYVLPALMRCHQRTPLTLLPCPRSSTQGIEFLTTTAYRSCNKIINPITSLTLFPLLFSHKTMQCSHGFSWESKIPYWQRNVDYCLLRHIYRLGCWRETFPVSFAVEKQSCDIWVRHTCLRVAQNPCLCCTRSQSAVWSSRGRLSLGYTRLAYLAGRTDIPSSQSPPQTKAAVSLLVLVGHQNHPGGNKAIDYLNVKATRKSSVYFYGSRWSPSHYTSPCLSER